MFVKIVLIATLLTAYANAQFNQNEQYSQNQQSLHSSQQQPQQQQQNLPVNKVCLGCLCEAISSCDQTAKCEGDVCGPFKLTWPYWADAGKPTLNNESKDSATAYANCAQDTYCSALAVQGYMYRFQQDCNGDGKIDCDDFALIHRNGGYGCKGSVLNGVFGVRYEKCKQYFISNANNFNN